MLKYFKELRFLNTIKPLRITDVVSKFYVVDQTIHKEMTKKVKLSEWKVRRMNLPSEYRHKITEARIPVSENYQNNIHFNITILKNSVFTGGPKHVILKTIFSSIWFKSSLENNFSQWNIFVITVSALFNKRTTKTIFLPY